MNRVFVFGAVGIALGVGSTAARADYSQEVSRDAPIAGYRFQDASTSDGATAKDETGQHPGVFHGGVTTDDGVRGIGGKAARFNGRSAYVEVPHHKDFALNALPAAGN